MNESMNSLAANLRRVRNEYEGTEDPFERLRLVWEAARLMLEGLDTIAEMAAQIEALEAIDIDIDLADLDVMREDGERQGWTGTEYAGLAYAQLDHLDVLILRGLAMRNPLRHDNIIITQKGIDHLKSLL